jgi:addiction module HigA family antidote
MQPQGLTANRLANALKVSRQRIGELLNGRRGITAETALRLSRFFGTTGKFWLEMQAEYDLNQAEKIWTHAIAQQIAPCAQQNDNASSSRDKSGKKTSLPDARKLAANEKKVYKLLSEKPIHFDLLCERSGLNAGQLSATLTMLELAELVTRHAGDWYSKI